MNSDMARRVTLYGIVLVVTAFSIAAGTAAGDLAETPGEKTGTGVHMIYLVRHGQYDYDDDRDPDIGKALVPLGIAQARLVAQRLGSLPVTMTSIYSSTMTRARQTALVIGQEFPDLELRQTRILRECTPPTWRHDIVADEDPDEMNACRDQLEKAYAEFFVPSPDADRHDLLVCHGNVIRYFVTKVLGVDTMSWLGMSVGNCSLTVVRINPDGTKKLLSVGDIGHIPPNLQTGLDRKDKNLVIPGQ
jgi:serine/threonine-protein phosphatase PGAM5